MIKVTTKNVKKTQNEPSFDSPSLEVLHTTFEWHQNRNVHRVLCQGRDDIVVADGGLTALTPCKVRVSVSRLVTQTNGVYKDE